MTRGLRNRQAVAELEEQSLQQAEELRTVREQLQQANAAVHVCLLVIVEESQQMMRCDVM